MASRSNQERESKPKTPPKPSVIRGGSAKRPRTTNDRAMGRRTRDTSKGLGGKRLG
jgi:hypothetical protein